MASLAAASLNGVKIYNLASGKTLPQWIAEKTKRALSKDEDYRRRVELLQDFHFPSGSQRVKMSLDGNYIVATGMYPPTVKVFDVRDLSMKFERRLDAEVVQFEVLSPDFGKLCFLQSDRSLCFHAPYGTHYTLRLPKFGRDMCYHREKCELYVAASGSDIYRVNLDEGRYFAPLEIGSGAANVVTLNPIHQLLGVGCEDGVVECWDTRAPQRAGILDTIVPTVGGSSDEKPVEVTALEFDDDGLTFAVGTSNGHALLYDLRSSKPLLHKSHQYGLPIIDLKFHDYSKKVLSTDSKVIKIWDKRDGNIFTNVETPADIRDVCVVDGAQGKSGVFLVAGEQERVMAYYLPELGIAPKWCSFLDSLTEELEEEAQSTVYDDYKFVTRQEVMSFGLEHMIGTPLLKAYMHGFFMDARLYTKVKTIAEPFAYDQWRKEQIKAKLEAKQSNRITIERRLPKINRATAERLLVAEKKKKKRGEGVDDDDDTSAFVNPLGDERFSKMFTSKDFEVDEESETYRLLHPNADNVSQQKKKRDDMDSDGATDDDEDEGDEGDEDAAVGGRFDLVSDEEDEAEGRPSDESSSEEEEEVPANKRQPSKLTTTNQSKHRKPKFYEIATGEKVGDLMAFGSSRDRMDQKQKAQLAKLPLAERMKLERVRENEKSSYKKEEKEGGGYMRELSFIPQSELRKQQKRADVRNGGKEDDDNEAITGRRKKRGVGDLKLANPRRNPRFRR